MSKSFTNADIKNLLDGKMDDKKVLYEELIDIDALHESVFTYYNNVSDDIKDAKEKIDVVEGEFDKEHIKDSEYFKTGSLAATKHNTINEISEKLNFNDILKLTPISDDPGSIISMAKQFNTNLVAAKHKVRIALLNQTVEDINAAKIVIDENSAIIDTFNYMYDSSEENEPIKTTTSYGFVSSYYDYTSNRTKYRYLKKVVHTYYISSKAHVGGTNDYEYVESMVKNIERESGTAYLKYNSDKIEAYNG